MKWQELTLVRRDVDAGTDHWDEIWQNNQYVVLLANREDGLTHLSIRRQDRRPVRDWRHLQRIKNQLCGPEREGVELFPAESRLMDTSNQYHLWVVPEGVSVELGYFDGRVVADAEEMRFGNAVQRKLEEVDLRHGGTTYNQRVQDVIRTQIEKNIGGAA
jgi:hypothetical protein